MLETRAGSEPAPRFDVPKREYVLFMSYAHDDAEVAERLTYALRDQGVDVWFAPDQKPGEARDALAKSDAVLVVVTPNTARSEFVREQLRHVFMDPKYKDHVFPVWLADVEPADAPSGLGYLPGFRLGRARESDIARDVAERLRQRDTAAPL